VQLALETMCFQGLFLTLKTTLIHNNVETIVDCMLMSENTTKMCKLQQDYILRLCTISALTHLV
jgi:hypothetical protein